MIRKSVRQAAVVEWVQRYRFTMIFCVVLPLFSFQPLYSVDQQSGAFAIATDQTVVTVSDKFYAPSPLGLKDSGDVFFWTSGPSSLFYWSYGSGTRTRLLQAFDPIPGYPGSVAQTVGGSFQMNSAGHAAMIHTWAQDGVRDPSGIFVYDGSQYSKVALTGEATPGISGGVFSAFRDLRINQNDQVAFIADFEPIGPYGTALFIGSPGGPPQKIASIEELEAYPDGNGYNTIALIGLDDSGRVAFLCDNDGDPGRRAIFIGDATGFQRVVATGQPAPGISGDFNLSLAGVSPYALNSAGDLAVRANVLNDPSVSVGIWIRSASGTLQKLLTNADATGTSLGGTFGGSMTLRGFDSAGKVLFSSNPSGGASSNHALFLKDAASQAQVIFYRGQNVAGRTEKFNSTTAALLNDSGKVAFVASLTGGTSMGGLFLGSGGTAPQIIVLAGDATPVGGAYTQSLGTLRINSIGQVVFTADISGLNASGLFIGTPGGNVRAIVSTIDSLPSGANEIVGGFSASDDEVLFNKAKAGGLSTLFSKSLHDGSIRRIVGLGDSVPGGGVVILIAGPLSINDNEEVAVLANWIVGGPVYPARAILISRPGNALQRLVMTGDPLPGGGTINNFVTAPLINNNGQVVFHANISGGTSTSGIFVATLGGPIQSVARLGDASPVGGTFTSFAAISLNDAGQVGFEAMIQDGSVFRKGLFVGSATSAPLKLVASGDSWSTFTVNGIKFHSKINSSGQMAYIADLAGQPDTIFLGTPGSFPEIIAQEDGPAPFPGGSVFVTFYISDLQDPGLVINDNGQVAFWAVYTVTGGPVLGDFGTGFFVGSAGSNPVARLYSGEALPGGGSFYGSLPAVGNIALANSGGLAMYAPHLMDAPDLPRFVVANKSGVLRNLAATGETAAGTGSEFGRLIPYVVANSAGRFFLGATLVNGPERYGIFESEIPTCTPGTTRLCLNSSRFEVEVDWSIPSGASGPGNAVPLTSDSGYFWFFSDTNVELVVKVLDGRGVNGCFWVFYGAMTDVQYTITVTDVVTGEVKTYQGQQGVQKSGNDINAFSEGGGVAVGSAVARELAKAREDFTALTQNMARTRTPAASFSAVSDTALFLNNNRFKVEVAWSIPSGESGVGTAIPMTSDSGYFWFFSPTNLELLVKVLDGRGINGHFWFFWGALTDVQYTITVTDTETGAVKTYQGQQGVQKSGNDINAF